MLGYHDTAPTIQKLALVYHKALLFKKHGLRSYGTRIRKIIAETSPHVLDELCTSSTSNPTPQLLPLTSATQPHPPVPAKHIARERFSFKMDRDLEEAKKLAVPKNTNKSTKWALEAWKEWSSQRQKAHQNQYSQWPVHLLIAEGSALNHWLSKFVLEARKADGEPYLPNTLFQICSGLLRWASR